MGLDFKHRDGSQQGSRWMSHFVSRCYAFTERGESDVVIVRFPQIRNPRHREGQEFALGHTESSWKGSMPSHPLSFLLGFRVGQVARASC